MTAAQEAAQIAYVWLGPLRAAEIFRKRRMAGDLRHATFYTDAIRELETLETPGKYHQRKRRPPCTT